MLRWEYCYVKCEFPRLFGAPTQLEEVKLKHINGQELSNWKQGEFAPKFISQMGDQGWELISVIAELSGGGSVGVFVKSFQLVFKRPKA